MEQFFIKLKSGLNFLLSRIAAVLLIAMTALVIYQVFTRYVLNSPADFTEELVRYLLIWTGFIGAAYGFSTRKEFSSLLGISRSLVYSMAPISGVFIMVAQAINIWEDAAGKTIGEEEGK